MFPWPFTRKAMIPPVEHVSHTTEGIEPKTLQEMRRPQVAKMSMRRQTFGTNIWLVDMVLDFTYGAPAAPVYIWGRDAGFAFPLRVEGSVKLPPGLCFFGGSDIRGYLLGAAANVVPTDDETGPWAGYGAWAVTRDRHFVVTLTDVVSFERSECDMVSGRLDVWCAASFVETAGGDFRFRATPFLSIWYEHQEFLCLRRKPRLVYRWIRKARWIESGDSTFDMLWTPGRNLVMHGINSVVQDLWEEQFYKSLEDVRVFEFDSASPDVRVFEPAAEGRVMDYVAVPRVR